MSLSWDELNSLRPKKEWRYPIPPSCRRCGYNLTGLPEDRCPECGTPFNFNEVRQRIGRIWSMTLRLRHANEDAVTGLIAGLVGLALMGIFRVLGDGLFVSLGDIMAFLCGVTAVILGAQIMNVRRVPSWARCYITNPQPNLLLGYGTMLLGLLLMLAAVVL